MITIKPDDRDRIEDALDRSLTDAELEPVESLAALTDDQVAIVAEIQPNNRLIPMLFLRAVVPSAEFDAINFYIDDVQRVYVERFPPPEIPDQRIFEHYAGRSLKPAERVLAGTVYKLSGVQIELLQLLARRDVTVAFLYLAYVAADDPIEVRHQVAKDAANNPT